MSEFAFKTNCGIVRQKNEDNAFVTVLESGDTLMMVLDGMGGHNKGEKASSMALDLVRDYITKARTPKTMIGVRRLIKKAIRYANNEVNILGTNNIEYNEMGTTIILAYIRNNRVIVANVGDSRCYFFDKHQIKQVSEDQTYVQFLYKTGKIRKEDMKIHPKRHVLMNALGTYPNITIDMKGYSYDNQGILLCTDGLYNMLEDDEIFNILNKSLALEDKVDLLIDNANANGGLDNIAVAILEVK